MGNNTYNQILDFIETYGGNQYKMLKKCNPGQELDYMTKGSEAGKAAREAFTSIVNTIGTSFDLKVGKVTQWQNSGTFVSYFWSQLKRAKYEDSKISLSLFAEKGQESIRFRASVELAVESAEDTDKESYKKILELPLKHGLTYISGGNNESEFRIIDETDNKVVKDAKYKKVQVSYIIEKKQVTDDEKTVSMLSDGVRELLGYYDYAFSEQITKIDDGNSIKKKKIEKKAGREQLQKSPKEYLYLIKGYIAKKGFTYEDGLIENFYLSLKSKPFVILAGTSGTGKTRLVKLFAEAIGAEYKMVSVRPDWSDGSDLFGHTDLNGNFIDGPICDAFDKAIADPSRPVLLCLDEMNLARVEYYLSDFLSVIESRERNEDGKIVTDPIAQYKDGIPANLYIIGTVNMDETTFPFSKKVLDRANTIEFSFVNLLPEFESLNSDAEPLHLSNEFLGTKYLVLARDCGEDKEFVIQVCDELQKVNAILRKANAHVGYRVRDEIVFYMLNNKKADDLLSFGQAFDNEIMQKILPRIQGSEAAIKDLLTELFKYCMGDYSGLDTESGNAGKQMQSIADTAKYPASAMKIGYMMTRYEEDGFTSYWL